MRYAVVHCRGCLHHVWVPEDRLGSVGKCPDCRGPVQAPADWPESQLVEGPHVVRDFEDEETFAITAH
jgi:hypothetical protein